jgi:cytochrome c biogenesis protein CcdA
MAAVFALVFLPVLASIMLFGTILRGDVSLATALAGACFIALGSGVFLGLYRMMKAWEGEHHGNT